MDNILDGYPSSSSSRSPRKELQGPRPAPLKVQKESHKIQKPSVPPQKGLPRPPVIIYTVSPKVIHANPSEFMNLVQRLTGSNYSSSSSPFQYNSGALISPAARFASIEKTRSPGEAKKMPRVSEINDVSIVEGVEISTDIERFAPFPGILSPNPASLPPIPSNFFSPPSDSNPLGGFFYDFSPVLSHNCNKNFLDSNTFIMPSPSTFISPRLLSPNTQSLDLFNHLFDL